MEVLQQEIGKSLQILRRVIDGFRVICKDRRHDGAAKFTYERQHHTHAQGGGQHIVKALLTALPVSGTYILCGKDCHGLQESGRDGDGGNLRSAYDDGTDHSELFCGQGKELIIFGHDENIYDKCANFFRFF